MSPTENRRQDFLMDGSKIEISLSTGPEKRPKERFVSTSHRHSEHGVDERYRHRHYRSQVSGYKCSTNTNTNMYTNINKRAKGESAECISWVLCFLCQRLPQSLHLLDIIVIMVYPHQGRYSLK